MPSGICSVVVVFKVRAPNQQHQHGLVKNAHSQIPTQISFIRTLRVGLNSVFYCTSHMLLSMVKFEKHSSIQSGKESSLWIMPVLLER